MRNSLPMVYGALAAIRSACRGCVLTFHDIDGLIDGARLTAMLAKSVSGRGCGSCLSHRCAHPLFRAPPGCLQARVHS